jgi:hypothetical protein
LASFNCCRAAQLYACWSRIGALSGRQTVRCWVFPQVRIWTKRARK